MQFTHRHVAHQMLDSVCSCLFSNLASAGFGLTKLFKAVLSAVAMAEVADVSLVASAAGGAAGGAGEPPPGGPGKNPLPPVEKEVPAGGPEAEEIPDDGEESEALPEGSEEVRLRPCRRSLGGCGMENAYLRKYACINPRCVQASDWSPIGSGSH